jgi:hypothetical protein
MPITRYLRRMLNDAAFGREWFEPPNELFIGILTGTPTISGSYTEVSYGGYQRVRINNDKDTFTDATDTDSAEITNNWTIYLPLVESGNNIQVTNIGYFDSYTGGKMLAFASYVKTLDVGDRLIIPAGALKIRFAD